MQNELNELKWVWKVMRKYLQGLNESWAKCLELMEYCELMRYRGWFELRDYWNDWDRKIVKIKKDRVGESELIGLGKLERCEIGGNVWNIEKICLLDWEWFVMMTLI